MTNFSKPLTLSILVAALGMTACDADEPQGPVDEQVLPDDLSPHEMAIAKAIVDGVPLSEVVDADGEHVHPAVVEDLAVDVSEAASPINPPFGYKEPECDWSTFPADFGPNASNWGAFANIEFAFNYDSPIVLGQAACQAVCNTCDADTEYSSGLYEWCTCRFVPFGDTW